MFQQTTRARAVDLRTYCRPKDDAGTEFETRQEMLQRSMYDHQENLMEDIGREANPDELKELRTLGEAGKAAVAGRTQWLGGTDIARHRACSQFNCSFLEVASVYDVTDAAWLLLNGSGVGFQPRAGTLHGYARTIPDLEIVPSTRPKDYKGRQENLEDLPDPSNGYTWTISVGDSAQAWAKAGGKMFAPRSIRADKLRLDFSEARGPGGRLKGYGWICNGYQPLADAFTAFHGILNRYAGNLLDDVAIMDVVNHWGTVLSSRRSAQIALMDSHNPHAHEFQRAKDRYWEGNNQRRQSNNTLLFWSKPTKSRIEELIRYADECGGDPAICNASAAQKRAPWFKGLNPCAEILLASKGFCNLVTNCLPRFKNRFTELERSVYIMARANYRQTCVNLEDGLLQPGWHQTNQALRLCGVSLTGVVQADWLTDHQIRRLRNSAIAGAYSMADELDLPRPKAVTTLKPEGTISKTLGGIDVGEIAEGIHKPLGRFVMNSINFSAHDPVLKALESAGYRTMENPSDRNNTLCVFPVEYDSIRFDKFDGKEVNLEPATVQLDRYLRWNTLWCDHNCSATISYSPEEIPAVVNWLYDNWDRGFVAVSLLRRNDPTKTAKDLGHPYLPQEVTTEGPFREYVASLRPVNWEKVQGIYEIEQEACATGACPIR